MFPQSYGSSDDAFCVSLGLEIAGFQGYTQCLQCSFPGRFELTDVTGALETAAQPVCHVAQGCVGTCDRLGQWRVPGEHHDPDGTVIFQHSSKCRSTQARIHKGRQRVRVSSVIETPQDLFLMERPSTDTSQRPAFDGLPHVEHCCWHVTTPDFRAFVPIEVRGVIASGQ